MKRSRIPSIGALTSFVAAARHGSFTSAAKELNLSQGAVSRQIRDLEEHLGTHLFERVRQRVFLTAAGKLYLSQVRQPLADLAIASRSVAAFSGDMTLNLAVLPTFASRWLMPRLPMFQKANPNIIVRLTTLHSAVEFTPEPFDVAVCHSVPNWPGTTAQHLLDVDLVAVCSPKLNAKRAVRVPADVTKFPLLHLMARPNRWTEWLTEAGVILDQPPPGHSYETSTMVAQAAVAGLGIALMPRALFEDMLQDNRLEIIGSDFPETKASYYLILSETRANSDVVQTFVRWLTKEAHRWRADAPMPRAKKRDDDIQLDRRPVSDRACGDHGLAG